MKLFITSDLISKQKMMECIKKIQKYNSFIFINKCISINCKKKTDRLDALKELPWIVNLCLKWSALSIGKKNNQINELSNIEFEKIISSAHDVIRYIPAGLSKDTTLDFFFRNILYQQTLYQTSLDITLHSICRQIYIFNNLEKTHKIRAQFLEITSVSLEDYFKLLLTLYSAILKYNNDDNPLILKNDVLANLLPKFNNKTIDDFMRTFSINIDQLQSFCEERTTQRPLSEYYSPSVFLDKPIIKNGEQYISISFQLLQSKMQTVVYDILKSKDPEKFMDSFGRVFETKIKELLDETGFNYKDEEYLKKISPKSKVTDFILTNGEANIFIDAKAVEMHANGKIALSQEAISSKIKTSVLKTIEQSYCINKEIYLGNIQKIDFKEESYIICITYKNLLLGNGISIEKTYAEKEIKKIKERYEGNFQIPINNLFCMSIDEFECFINSCKANHIAPHIVLRDSVLRNKSPNTRLFFFQQHLEKSFKNLVSSEKVRQTGIKLLDSLLEEIKSVT